MNRATAARYVDLSERAFTAEVARGRLPQATVLGNRHHWYRPALDKALAALAGERGEDMPEWEREYWAKGEKAA